MLKVKKDGVFKKELALRQKEWQELEDKRERGIELTEEEKEKRWWVGRRLRMLEGC